MAETRSSSRVQPVIVAGTLSALLWALPAELAGGTETGPHAKAVAQTAPVEGELAMTDIAKAIDDIQDLGKFFAKLARNDPNRYAARLWASLQERYAGAAQHLNDLQAAGRIQLGTLPEGTASLVDDGTIVVDRDLADRWLPRFVRSARRSGDDWQYTSLLSTLLLQDLRHLEPRADRTWFREHLARSKLAETVPQDAPPRLARHLAGFWHIKDKHLQLALLSSGTEDPDQRRMIEGRKIDLLSEIRTAAQALERELGPAWAERLWLDWQDYHRQISRFTASRSWLIAAGPAARQAPPAPEAAEVPLPIPKPETLRQAAPTQPPAPAALDFGEEARLAEVTAALERSRAQAQRREAALMADLEASRQELAAFEADLAQSGRTVSDLREALAAERDARRAEAEALRAQLAAEQRANREKAAKLEQDMAAELEASRQALGRLREQLAAERAAGREALAGVKAELAALRDASRRNAEQAERQLAAELEASREKVEVIRRELTAELETGRQQTVLREAEIAAALDAERRDSARKIAALSAELAASRDAAAGLRERVAELEAGSPPVPQAMPAEESGAEAWLPVAVVVVLLVLGGLAAAAAVRHRHLLPIKTAPALPIPGQSAATPAVEPAAVPAEGPVPDSEEKITPQTVVEALRRGDTQIFEERFARLAGLRAAQLNRILHERSGEDLAIVCRALGMDKLLLASIYLLSHKGQPAGSRVGPRDLSRVTAFYDRITEASARQVLGDWQRDPGLPGVIERLQDAAARGDAPKQPGAAE